MPLPNIGGVCRHIQLLCSVCASSPPPCFTTFFQSFHYYMAGHFFSVIDTLSRRDRVFFHYFIMVYMFSIDFVISSMYCTPGIAKCLPPVAADIFKSRVIIRRFSWLIGYYARRTLLPCSPWQPPYMQFPLLQRVTITWVIDDISWLD